MEKKTIHDNGIKLIKKRQFHKAESIFKNILEEYPNDFDAYYHLADIKYREKKFVEAEKIIDKCLRIRPDLPRSLGLKSSILREKDDFDGSLIYIDRALSLKPDDASLLTNKGGLYYKMNKFKLAEEYYRKAHDLKPTSSSLYRLAVSKIGQELYDESLKLIDTWLTSHPKDWLVLDAKAYALHEKKDYVNSLRCLQQIQKIKPNFSLRNIAHAYLDLKKPKLALPYLKKIIKQNPKDTMVLTDYVRCLLSMEKYNEAKKILKKILLLKPNNAQILTDMSMVLDRLSDYSESIKYAEKALLLKPNDHHLLAQLGYLNLRQSQFDEATSYFEKAMKVDPFHANTLYNFACLKSLSGDAADAIFYLSKACKLDAYYKKLAKKDSDFSRLKKLKEFRKLIK